MKCVANIPLNEGDSCCDEASTSKGKQISDAVRANKHQTTFGVATAEAVARERQREGRERRAARVFGSDASAKLAFQHFSRAACLVCQRRISGRG